MTVAGVGHIVDEEREIFTPHGLTVLTLEGGRIAEISAFLEAELNPLFGLPEEIEPAR